jgi:HEAT repeat protein
MGPDAKGAAEALGEALKSDKSELVREAAAKALGGKMAEKGHTQVLALGVALKDKHAGVRVAAAESLRDLGEKARAALEPLLEILKNKELDRFSRFYAAQVMGRFAEDVEKTGPVLIEVAGEKSAHVSVRVAAIESLGRLKLEDAVAALGNLLEYFPKDPKGNAPVEIRLAAAVALMKIPEKTKSVWSTIEKSLKIDPDPTVRSQAIRLAGGLGREESGVVPALIISCTKDASPDCRVAAIQELGELGRVAASAKDTLMILIREDARQSIRDAAAAALKKIDAP